MDWLRRNWPDLLIGVALVAVIAGIVATLLTGGSFFPIQTSAPGSPDSTPSVSAPAPEERETEGGAGEEGPDVAVLPPSDAGGAEGGEEVPPGAPDPDEVEDRGAAQQEVAEPAEEEPERTIEPLAVDEEPSDPPDASVAASAAESPAEDAPDEEAAAAAARSAADASADAGANAGGNANAGLPTDPYRVSVGAFASEENAQSQADRFRGDGFPVFIGRQGDLSLVLVGPYEQEAEAQAAAQRILAGDYDIEPVIYRFEPDAAGAPAPQASAQPQAEPESQDPPQAAASEAEAPPAGSDGTVLQVGAYADVASAEPFEERLASLGFAPRRLREDGFVKIVVGPFSGGALNDARVLLDGAGIEYFAR